MDLGLQQQQQIDTNEEEYKDKDKDKEEGEGGVLGVGSKTPRLPRWSRQEILVLIQGKRMAETHLRSSRRGRITNTSGTGTSTVEPKWATVSSYCKRHGVNRGPVQCRKRWSNLAADFKKIKDWESHLIYDQDNNKQQPHLDVDADSSSSAAADSFWVMRNDLRRDRKLPGFFDKEVYDILDGQPQPQPQQQPPTQPPVFDSGRTATAADGLFSDDHHLHLHGTPSRPPNHTPTPPSPTPTPTPTPIPIPPPISGTCSEKQSEAVAAAAAAMNPEKGSTSRQEARKKRKRGLCDEDLEDDDDDDDDDELLEEPPTTSGTLHEHEREREREHEHEHDQLVGVLERNGRILSAQLDAHVLNLKLDREQRKDNAASLVAVLDKLADAVSRIADKL